MKKFSKKDLIKLVGGTAIASALIFSSTSNVFAHGWIVNDRAHLGSSRGGNRNTNMGNATWEPQSVGEARGRVVENGTVSLNDAISANSGNIGGFPRMRDYGANRWHRTNMSGGPTDLQWWFTAPHRTSSIRYYVSRPGTDFNRPLNFADFEHVQTFNYGGQAPTSANRLHTHRVNLPTGRSGPAVILAAWHVSDNNVTWYRVVDINFTGNGSGNVTAPTTPTNPPTTQPTNPPVTTTPPVTQPTTPPVAPPVTTNPPVQPGSYPVWTASATFVANNRVIHNGQIWRAQWWTRGEEPGTTGQWGVWVLVGPANTAPAPQPQQPVTPPVNPAPTTPVNPPVTQPTTPPTNTTDPASTNVPNWSASVSFNAGDIVRHNNFRWRAEQATQGVTPGTNNSIWRMMGR
ncbi:MAG: lytic polysaccharide monooxygenase [Defluviitaleaceae bacterium]|nr:lytic polysaccharide monooxygenase [Defluviitaleaceae bacterium]